MKKTFLLVLCSWFLVTAFSQNKPAYVLYNAKSKKTSYQKMLRKLQQKDIVLFGEFHNNPISHWLELEVTKDLKQTRSVVLGAEMFEQDDQPALDLYCKESYLQKV